MQFYVYEGVLQFRKFFLCDCHMLLYSIAWHTNLKQVENCRWGESTPSSFLDPPVHLQHHTIGGGGSVETPPPA